MLRLLPATLLALVLPMVFADVEFTNPSAGDVVSVGSIEVQWKDSGTDPSILDLTQYTLLLMTGGNTNDTMRPISTFVSGGMMSAGYNASGTISAGVAGPLKNGFFFKMISASRMGGEVINFSSRFSIDGLTGYTPPIYRDAAARLDGSTERPDEADAQASRSTSTSASATGDTSLISVGTATYAVDRPPGKEQDVAPKMPGLSVGTQAGIGVAGAAVGGLLVGLIIWIVALRRKKRKVNEIEEKRKSQVYIDGKAEMSGDSLRKHPSTSTASTFTKMSPPGDTVEMSGRPTSVREMDGDGGIHETPGSLGASEAPGSATASEMEGSTAVYELPAQRFSKHGT